MIPEASVVEKRPLPLRYGVAMLTVVLAFLLKFLLDPLSAPEVTPFRLFLIAVVISAWYGGLGPGLLATALVLPLADYFFLAPLDSFTGLSLKTIPLALFALEGVLSSLLISALHGARARAETKTRETLERQEQLRSSEERFRLLVDGVEDYAIFMLDPEGRITSWNSGAERIVGYRADEILGGHFSRFFTPEGAEDDMPARELETAAREGRFEGEVRRVCKDGSEFEASVIVTAVRGENGELRGFAKVVHDITERKRVEGDLHRSLASLLALYEAGRVFGSSLKQEQICSELLAVARRLPGLSMASVELRDERDASEAPRVFVTAGEVWRLRDTQEAQTMRRMALRTGRVQRAELPSDGSKAGPFETLILPLGARGGVFGVLEAYGSEVLSQKDNGDTLTSLAGQAASALENARLYEELAERERRLHELVRQLLTAQEEERRRVAHDIHDGLAQTAAAAYQALQVFARRRQPRDSGHGQELEEALELVRQTVGEARQVISNLRPTVLDDFGLAAAVRLQVETLRSEGLDVGYEETLGNGRLPPEVETTLFRVAQEALTNVRKHARTSRARVSLEHLGGTVRLLVRDEGSGFRPEEATNGAGPGEKVGLSGMRERIALLGGRFEIQTGPQAGTSVLAEVRLPATGEDDDHG